MSLSYFQRLQYFVWAASSVLERDRFCPSCNSSQTCLVKRKYLVSSLWECKSCGLRFRLPKDDAPTVERFYQHEYSEGFTTNCPSADVLSSLIATKFSGSEKDYGVYISVLKAVGMKEGDALLDFGASWGYGSWQLQQAGFRVFSHEMSKTRAEFARTRLSCNVIESVHKLSERVKCLFSAHVIEHLPNPNLIWEAAATVLAEDGIIVCFCPNGEPTRESLMGVRQYHQLWGKVHPLVITPRFFHSNSARYRFRSFVYSSPYRVDQVTNGTVDSETTGDELCLIARRAGSRSSVS